MELQEKVEHWLDIAEYDMETAAAMQESGRYLYTVFMCQQAIEKLLKALYIQQYGQEAPRTHNLLLLVSKLNLPAKSSYLQIMGQLNAYYIKGRYPTYKQKLTQLLSRQNARELLQDSQEIFQWLKSFLSVKR
ncbi:MAG: HEPN domain-containing protein [Chloroflexi bacterium]|nr:MAG: HEPN domain-containing protein [Chloroflexota bacterium]